MPGRSDRLSQQRARQELEDIEPVKVDLVDRAANKRKFLVFKEETMPDGIPGPELAQVGDDLTNPETAAKLDRAAEALGGLTQQMEALVTGLNKGDDTPTPEIDLEAEVTTTTVGTLETVAAKAGKLAKAVDAAKEPDKAKLTAEVGALTELLKGVLAKYEVVEPEPAPVPEPEPAPEPVVDPFESVKGLADQALGLASQISTAKAVSKENLESIRSFSDIMTKLAEGMEVAKSETQPELAEIFSQDDPAADQLADAVANILRDFAGRIGAVVKMAEVTDNSKAEIGTLRDILAKAADCIPTKKAKAAKSMIRTLKDVTGRALGLSQQASEAKFEDVIAMRELDGVKVLLDALTGKYAEVEKSEDFDLTDLGQILNADRMLSQFEAQLHKFTVDTAQPEPAPEPEPAPAPEGPNVDELVNQISALGDQIKTMQAQVAKARNATPPPASGGADPETPAPEGGDNADLMFPQNYNDPQHREELKKRGLEV